MSSEEPNSEERFVSFFLAWAQRQQWVVPDIHIRICAWLATVGHLGVLRVFRGAGKSTILAIYNAWRFYENQGHRILHQGDKDATAHKTSRDTRNVLRMHPWTGHMREIRGGESFWWTPGATDERNPSMQAAGITTGITSSRADEIQNDDVEVPRNIRSAESRERMRYWLAEQTHILVPGGRKLFVGTPHTHDSLYDQIEGLGAETLTIRLFDKERRVEDCIWAKVDVDFEPEFVFTGIGRGARLLKAGLDYRWIDGRVYFDHPPNALVDFYSGCAWPERFNGDDLLKRRRSTRNINEWDSQYQLHSKPVTTVRLDPKRLVPYNEDVEIDEVNGEPRMMLMGRRIIGASAYWDCALGKSDSDASVFALVLTDERGHLYWHLAEALTGDLAIFDGDNQIVGGQVQQAREIAIANQIPGITVETNGSGGFVPNILRQALKGVQCAVSEKYQIVDKDSRILDALEPPMSMRCLWVRQPILNGPLWEQMRDYVPGSRKQADDYLDAGAGAIAGTPIRIGRLSVVKQTDAWSDWRPVTGPYRVQVNY